MMLLEHAIRRGRKGNDNPDPLPDPIRNESDDRKGTIDVLVHAAERKARTYRYMHIHVERKEKGRARTWILGYSRVVVVLMFGCCFLFVGVV